MKKNNYIQPLSEAVELNPMQVLCASDPSLNVNTDPMDDGAGGDAPKRRIF